VIWKERAFARSFLFDNSTLHTDPKFRVIYAKPTNHKAGSMKPLKISALGMILGVFLLSGCETTSAALDGVGGVFIGAGQDVRSVAR